MIYAKTVINAQLQQNARQMHLPESLQNKPIYWKAVGNQIIKTPENS